MVRRRTQEAAGRAIDVSYITDAFMARAFKENNAHFDVSNYLTGDDADAATGTYGGEPANEAELAFGHNAAFVGMYGWKRQLADYKDGRWVRSEVFVTGYESARVVGEFDDGTPLWEFRWTR
jgi:hypothetical protein